MLARTLRGQLSTQFRALSTAYSYAATGNPSSVLSKSSVDPVASPGSNQVSVNWLAAGVDPVDLATLAGDIQTPSSSFFGSALPAVPGNEGVGVVTAVGSSVSGVSAGDHVIPVKSGLGTWSESGTVNGSDVVRIPNIQLELAATLSTSPFTAMRLLNDFAKLSPGDVVLQNAGEGPVAAAVAQIGNTMGLRVVTTVTNVNELYAPTVERLKIYGSEVVVGEEYVESKGFKEAIIELPPVKLILNGGSVKSCGTLVKVADSGAKLVTYYPGSEDTKSCSKKGIETASFSLSDWLSSSSREEVEKMVSCLSEMVEEGKLTAWLQRVEYDKIPLALQNGSKMGRKFVAIMPSASQ